MGMAPMMEAMSRDSLRLINLFNMQIKAVFNKNNQFWKITFTCNSCGSLDCKENR